MEREKLLAETPNVLVGDFGGIACKKGTSGVEKRVYGYFRPLRSGHLVFSGGFGIFVIADSLGNDILFVGHVNRRLNSLGGIRSGGCAFSLERLFGFGRRGVFSQFHSQEWVRIFTFYRNVLRRTKPPKQIHGSKVIKNF